MRAMVMIMLGMVACTRPAEERALAELDVGIADADTLHLDVAGGLAAIRSIDATHATLWSGAPTLDITLTGDAPLDVALTVMNAMPDAVLTAPASLTITVVPAAVDDRPTMHRYRLAGPAGSYALHLGTADADDVGPFRVAAMADIQTALPTVDEVFARIAEVPGLRFVVGMGDITQRARTDEYDLFEAQLAYLPIPFYTTLGNHELWEAPGNWFRRFGRASFQFMFRDVAFTFADSGDAGMDPIVHGWIDEWLHVPHDQLHLLLTHVPPVEPSGARAGSFRNRREALDLVARMAAGGIDLALYGHIHTLMTYEHAGIPAWISGGGGATPEKWDGIGRHFLVLDLDGQARTADVGVVRVD